MHGFRFIPCRAIVNVIPDWFLLLLAFGVTSLRPIDDVGICWSVDRFQSVLDISDPLRLLNIIVCKTLPCDGNDEAPVDNVVSLTVFFK